MTRLLGATLMRLPLRIPRVLCLLPLLYVQRAKRTQQAELVQEQVAEQAEQAEQVQEQMVAEQVGEVLVTQ